MRFTFMLAAALTAVVACKSTQTTDRPTAARQRQLDEAWREAARQPLPPGVARVTIERYEVNQRDTQAVEAAIRYRDEHIDVRAGDLGANGLVIFGAESGVEAALRVSGGSSYTRRSSSQFLLLNEGTSGSLQLLDLQARPWTVVIPIWRGAVVVRTLREEITGSGMYVGVHRAGPDTVTVALTPYFNSYRHSGEVAIEELATTLTLRPGVPYVVMQDEQHESSVASALLSRTSTEANRQVIVILRVDTAQ